MRHTMTMLLLLLFALTPADAAKIITRSFKTTLADGRTVVVTPRGDEFGVCYFTEEGEPVKYDNGKWRVAESGEMAAANSRMLSLRAKSAPQLPVSTRFFPHSGTPKALVLMVDFADRRFTYSHAEIDKWLNDTEYQTFDSDYGYSSVAQYFNDSSKGKFRPVFDLKGPYTLPNNVKYYGQNSTSTDSDIPERRTEMLTEACRMAHDAGVNFKDYDSDGDGRVDLIYIIYAGFGEHIYNPGTDGRNTNADYLWAMSSSYSGVTYDGVSSYRYGISNELQGYEGYAAKKGWDKDKLTGIGVFIHEMGHTLGLPDVYPTVSWSDRTWYDDQSMESWDVMDDGQNLDNTIHPIPYSAWEREWMGWDTIEELTASGDYTAKTLASGGKAYKIINPNDASGNEFYVLEALPTGAAAGWYICVPNRGLLVTHINYISTYFENFGCPNNIHGSPRWTIIPANGKLYTSYRSQLSKSSPNYMSFKELQANRKGNVFPGTGNVTSLSVWKEYNPTMNVTLSNITQTDANTVTFTANMGSTGIKLPVSDMDTDSGDRIYNLNGICVGNGTEKLPKGVYVRNGRKFVVQ